MKFRTGFVTNSSSSSFLVAYRGPADLARDLLRFTAEHEDDEYSHQYKDVVYDIFKNHINYKEALKIFRDYTATRIYNTLRNDNKYVEYKSKYDTIQEWTNSREFIQMHKELVDKEVEGFKNSVTHNGYFALLQYSDSDGYYDVEPNLHKMLNCTCIRMEEH